MLHPVRILEIRSNQKDQQFWSVSTPCSDGGDDIISTLNVPQIYEHGSFAHPTIFRVAREEGDWTMGELGFRSIEGI